MQFGEFKIVEEVEEPQPLYTSRIRWEFDFDRTLCLLQLFTDNNVRVFILKALSRNIELMLMSRFQNYSMKKCYTMQSSDMMTSKYRIRD